MRGPIPRAMSTQAEASRKPALPAGAPGEPLPLNTGYRCSKTPEPSQAVCKPVRRGCPRFSATFCGCPVAAVCESSKSRRPMRSACMDLRRSGRMSDRGCSTTPASNGPAATKRTAAGPRSNESGQDAIHPTFQGQPKGLGISGTATSGCLRQSNVDFRGAVDFADSMKSELLL